MVRAFGSRTTDAAEALIKLDGLLLSGVLALNFIHHPARRAEETHRLRVVDVFSMVRQLPHQRRSGHGLDRFMLLWTGSSP